MQWFDQKLAYNRIFNEFSNRFGPTKIDGKEQNTKKNHVHGRNTT